MSNTWNAVAVVAVVVTPVALVLFHRRFYSYVLNRWGKGTRGRVVSCIARKEDGGLVYVVSYEFTVSVGSGPSSNRVGRLVSQRSLSTNDIVAVQYLRTFPVFNRLVEQTA